MNILGIMGFGQNPAACLLRDGELVAFVEEERLNRLKGSDGMFPAKAVSYCLTSAKLQLNDIDRIAFGWDCSKYPWTMLRNFGGNYLKYRPGKNDYYQHKDSSSVFTALETLFEFNSSVIESKIHEGIRSAGYFGDIPKIEFVSHHMAHAYSTFYSSGFENAGILTLDGSGEDISTQLSVGNGRDIKVVESFPIPHSIGWFYAAITQYLGLIPYRDEGKLMGLAALGEVRRDKNKWIEPLSKVLLIGDGSYEVEPTYTKFGGHYYGNRFTDKFVKLLTSVDAAAMPVSYGEQTVINGEKCAKYLSDVYVDIAWAAQELLERAAIMLAKKLVNRYGQENICVSGGVAMNCKMNGEILRKSGCKNIHVFPASSDGGTAVGAAMAVAQKMGDDAKREIKNVYYGPGYSNEEIATALNNCKIKYKEVSDPSEDAAKMLEEGKIISWFQGRMEFGARALGGRSILACPVYPDIKNKVNKEVKYREAWRPFCPSMLDSAKETYLEDPNESSFMIVAYNIKKDVKENVPSIVHVDDTVRPQAVTQEANPLFHSLISNLGKRTGHPIVLNTSFNVRSEPIVCTPLDAVRCFYSNGLDALVVGNFVLTK